MFYHKLLQWTIKYCHASQKLTETNTCHLVGAKLGHRC